MRTWYAQQWVRDTLVAEVTEGLRKSGEGSLEDSLISVRPFNIDVASIRRPVLAVHGSADDWEPLPNLRRVLALVPDAQLFVLDGLNHFGPLMYPDLLISLASPGNSHELPRLPVDSADIGGQAVNTDDGTARELAGKLIVFLETGAPP